MPLVVADRVQETTTTTGTGTITLAGAVAGFQSFAAVGNTNTTYYCITSGNNWEVGIGTYSTTGPTLARTTILASSAAGAAITLAGTSVVFCVYPAGKSFGLDQVLAVANGGTGATTAVAARVNLTGFSSITATGATTTLTATSNAIQYFTGASGQTVKLPDSQLCTPGQTFTILNKTASSSLTLQYSDATSAGTLPNLTVVIATCIAQSPIQSSGWSLDYYGYSGTTGTGLAVFATSPSITDLLLNAGSTTTPPLQFTAGTNLNTAAAGAVEYNGSVFFATENTTTGRGALSSYNVYQQTANGTTTTAATIADFFPANSSISLAATTLYEIECWCYFLKTTAGTVTFTMTASSAPTWMNGYYIASGITGINVAAAVTTGWTGSAGATTAAWAATGSLTTAVNHGFRFKIRILTNLATNWRMRYTSNTGTTQSLIGSYYTVRVIPTSTGTFVA